MRILIVTSEAPLPPPSGARLVVQEILNQLERDHEVHVIAIRDHDQDAAELAADAPVQLVEPSPDDAVATAADVVRAFVTGRPPRVRRDAERLRPPLRQRVASWRPDVVHLLPGAMVGLAGAVGGIPTVLTALDASHLNIDARARESGPLRRLGLAWKRRQWERCIARDYPRFDRVTVVSEEDRRAILDLAPDARVEMIPNGVDTERFRPSDDTRGDQRLVFHGVLRYPPNVTAARMLARQVLPRVRSEVPDARLELIGLDPTPEVRDLGRLPGVTVTGWVDDIAAALTRADVYVCPMTTGTGIKNKLLEAMACGLPCVATPLATQGLQVVDDVHLRVRGSEEGIAAAVVGLLRDRGTARDLGAAAREHVLANHSWRSTVERYVDVYRAVGISP